MAHVDPNTKGWPSALRDAGAKFDRAIEHLGTLREAERAFLASDPKPYYLAVEFESEEGCYVARMHIRHMPPLRFAAILGDVVHNLRSALDIAAWQIACKKSRRKAGRHSRQIYFPLTKTPEAFCEHRIRPFVSEDAFAVFERFQPYKGPDALERHPLWWLREISNEDKHQALQRIFGELDVSRTGIRKRAIDIADLDAEMSIEWLASPMARLDGSAKVAYIRFSPMPSDPSTVEVDVTRQPTASVLLSQWQLPIRAFGDIGAWTLGALTSCAELLG